MEDALARFSRSLNLQNPLTQEDLLSLFRRVEFMKGQCFLRSGEPAKKLGFVERGIFRFFYAKDDGTDAIRAFIAEGGFLASRVSFYRDEPAPFTIVNDRYPWLLYFRPVKGGSRDYSY